MTISPPEREAKKVKIVVDRNPTETSFERWSKPGHFSRTLSKGPATTTWIWNLHADAHDFDSHTTDLEEISRKFSHLLLTSRTQKQLKQFPTAFQPIFFLSVFILFLFFFLSTSKNYLNPTFFFSLLLVISK